MRKPLLELLRAALDMEREGHDFYLRAVLECRSDAARAVFQMLADEEIAHLQIIESLYDRVTGGADPRAALTALEATTPRRDTSAFFYNLSRTFRRQESDICDDREALRIALQFERRAVALYQGWLEDATDPLARALLRLLVAEEETHVAILSDMQAYQEDPSGWLDRVGSSIPHGM